MNGDELEKINYPLLFVELLIIVLTLIGAAWSFRAKAVFNDVEQEKSRIEEEFREYDSAVAVGNDEISGRLKEFKSVLIDAVARLEGALLGFLCSVICGLMIMPALMIAGFLYYFEKKRFQEEFWSLHPVNTICGVLIIIFSFCDIISPLLQAGDYFELLNETREVLSSISYASLHLMP